MQTLVSRRYLLSAAAVLAVAIAVVGHEVRGAADLTTVAGATLNIEVEGANAHVISLKHDTFEFGPMKPGDVCGNESPHELWLLVPDNLQVKSDLPEVASSQFTTFLIYRLSGLTGMLDLQGSGKPKLPPLAAPGTSNQLTLVPDISQFVADPRLNPAWRDRLNARFVLTGGSLTVLESNEPPANGAVWEFKSHDGQGSGVSQIITDRLRYTRELAQPELVIKFNNGKQIAISTTGTAMNLKLLTATEASVTTVAAAAQYKIGESAHEYCRLYEVLLNPPAANDRPLPVLISIAAQGGRNEAPRPGKYCGGARFLEH